jgi:hypothetical protein
MLPNCLQFYTAGERLQRLKQMKISVTDHTFKTNGDSEIGVEEEEDNDLRDMSFSRC